MEIDTNTNTTQNTETQQFLEIRTQHGGDMTTN